MNCLLLFQVLYMFFGIIKDDDYNYNVAGFEHEHLKIYCMN